MDYLKRHWKSRTLILLLLGTAVSLAMWGLEFTDWAAELNAQSLPHGAADAADRKPPPAALMAILPFVKCMVFIVVPASVVIWVRTLFRKLTGNG